MTKNGSMASKSPMTDGSLKKIEQRLEGIDENLRNITQMMTTLTIEKNHEPVK